MRLTHKGDWPGLITVRQGWARAEARPWNDEMPDASVRLIRGGAGFLCNVRDYLNGLAESVLSPPLPEGGTSIWRQAGFSDHLELELYRHNLERAVPEPDHGISELKDPPWRQAMGVDRAAFDVLWRLGELGLREAYRAVPRSAFLAIEDSDGLAGYAIVGASASLGYLQRIAVDPRAQRNGLGRALLRGSMRYVRAHGGRSVLLNTQPENEPASALYESEGFLRDRHPLHILKASKAEGQS
ncbi:MAG: GNAT family N-acetyltransferase [Acidimicrobiia bacterium]